MEEQMPMQCTLKGCQDELRASLISLAVTLEHFYGDHAFRSLMGEGGTVASDEEIMASVNFNRFQLFLRLPDAYDYAFKGKMGGFMEGGKGSSYFELLRDFLSIADTQNGLIEEIWVHFFHGVDRGCLGHLLEMGEARHALDYGVQLSAKDIALLAGITERSVQNAFSTKGPGKLKATKYGSLSMVAVEDARQWLADKKGFIATTKIQFTEADELPKSLDSQAELRAFLASRVIKVLGEENHKNEGKLPNTDLGEFFGISAIVAEDKLVYGTKPIELSDATKFAARLNIDRRWLIEQILRINHPQEAEILLSHD